MSPQSATLGEGRDPIVRSKLDSLTAIRFFAALLVVCFHVGVTPIARYSSGAAEIAAKGYSAVGLFYALSGFVLAYNYANRRTPYRKFVVARIARIYPAYALALLLAFPAFIMHVRADHEALAKVSASIITVPVLLQAWFPQTALTWNSPAWSLSVEAFFYVLFPLMLPVLIRSSINGLKILLVALCIASLIPSLVYFLNMNMDYAAASRLDHHFWAVREGNSILGLVNFNPLMRLPEFVAGIVIGLLFLRNQEKRVARRWSDFMSAAAVLAIVAIMAIPDLAPYPLLHNGALLPLWCVLLYSLACSSVVSKMLSLPILLTLGEISYGMYILQQPVSSLFKLLLLKVNHLAIKGDYPSMTLFLIYVGLLIVISYGSHRWLEIPAGAWIRRRFAIARSNPDRARS